MLHSVRRGRTGLDFHSSLVDVSSLSIVELDTPALSAHVSGSVKCVLLSLSGLSEWNNGRSITI